MPPKKLRRTVPPAILSSAPSTSISSAPSTSFSTAPTTNLSYKINLNYFMLLRAVTEVSRDTLYKVFLHGTPNKTPMENLREYLRIKRNLSVKTYNNKFDTNMRDKIMKDPSGKHFDVSLLYNAIKYSCDSLAGPDDKVWHDETLNKPDPTLEFQVTQVKKFRNCLIHTPEALDDIKLQNKIQEICNMLKILISKACKKYNVDATSRVNYTQGVDEQLDNIMKLPLDMDDVVKIVDSMTPQEQMMIVHKVPSLVENLPVDDVVKIVENMPQDKQKELLYKVPYMLENLPVDDVVKLVEDMTPQEQKKLVHKVPSLLEKLSEQDVEKIVEDMTEDEIKIILNKVLKMLSKNVTLTERWQTILDLLKPNPEVLKQNFVEEVQKNRKQMFGGKDPETVSPVSFLFDHLDLDLDVDQVYIKLRTSRQYNPTKEEEIDSSQLFTHVVDRKPGKPALLMVVGPAGSGKTTMHKMITQEWKSSYYTMFKDLHQYEVTIRAKCRDSHINSFTKLLETSLPNSVMQFKTLMPELAKKTNLLVLFDGLDEQNNHSALLVRNVMDELRECASATLMITSRPEGTHQFLSTPLKEGYEIFYWTIIGVPVDKKVDFVTKFCEEVKRKNSHLPVDQQLPLCTNKLGDLYRMVEEGKMKEYLSIPLHLVFLATVFMFEPDKVKPLPTETRLFYEIHQLCQRRLVAKMRDTGKADSISDDDLNNSIKIVSEKMYSFMLERLKEGQLTLTTEQGNDLLKICKKEEVDARMVISAFLTLQKCNVSLTETVEIYTAHHKGIQEYFAACAIMCQLKQNPELTIKQFINSKNSNLESFKEVLKRVMGLLHIPELARCLPRKGMLQKEVIELLSEAEITNNQWLDVLEDNEVTCSSLSLIAARMNEKEIEITDGRLASFVDLRPHLNPTLRKIISIILRSNNTDQVELKKIIAGGHDLYEIVDLQFRHHYHHPATDVSDDNILGELLNYQPIGLRNFTGHLSASSIGRLSSDTLTVLSLAVLHQNQVDALNQASLPALHYLRVHVPVRQVIGDLNQWSSRLPRVVSSYGGSGVELYLSGVDDDETSTVACQLGEAMCPPDPGYLSIWFPRSTLCGKSAWTSIITHLANKKIKVEGGLRVSESCVTEEEWIQLNNLIRNTTRKSVWGRPDFARSRFSEWQQ